RLSRPGFTPFALARARPALTRSTTWPSRLRQTRRTSGTSCAPRASWCRAPAGAGTGRTYFTAWRSPRKPTRSCKLGPRRSTLRRYHVDLAGGDILQQPIEARTLVAAVGAADVGVLVEADDHPARALSDRSSSRRWFSVVCPSVLTR